MSDQTDNDGIGSTKDTEAQDSPPIQQETTEVVTETTTEEVPQPEPSTPAQDVVDAVHEEQAEATPDVVTETSTTEITTDTTEATDNG